MKYLDYKAEELEKIGGIYTAKEINNQPNLWDETYNRVTSEKGNIHHFLGKFKNEKQLNVILVGAGTSAFIGEILAGSFQQKFNTSCRAVGTTDILTHPNSYFIEGVPTLIVSFARSGDSPESVEAVKIARRICGELLYELTITCNKDGALALMSNSEKSKNAYLFLLPEKANDLSLAMTGSFSSMVLAATLILNIENIEQYAKMVQSLCSAGNYILNNYLEVLKEISSLEFERSVFLGSGPFLGTAHESHLKVQELTAGKVISKFDSFLGFRHGPKAVVNEKTLLVYLFSNDLFVRKYEEDLAQSVLKTDCGEKTLAIGCGIDNCTTIFNYSILIPDEINDVSVELQSMLYILPAQIIGFYKSINLGISPDSPSKTGAISRVVEGVRIYENK
jgi:tagatose-6-phosphate ketose/aldose isomerase